MDSLTAKANVGAGTDTLAGVSTASGFVGAVTLTDESGSPIQTSNGVPIRITSVIGYTQLTRATTSGATTSGAYSVAIRNAGASDATVAGGTLKAGEEISIEPPSGGALAAIAYDPQSSELLIVEVNNGSSGGGGS